MWCSRAAGGLSVPSDLSPAPGGALGSTPVRSRAAAAPAPAGQGCPEQDHGGQEARGSGPPLWRAVPLRESQASSRLPWRPGLELGQHNATESRGQRAGVKPPGHQGRVQNKPEPWTQRRELGGRRLRCGGRSSGQKAEQKPSHPLRPTNCRELPPPSRGAALPPDPGWPLRLTKPGAGHIPPSLSAACRRPGVGGPSDQHPVIRARPSNQRPVSTWSLTPGPALQAWPGRSCGPPVRWPLRKGRACQGAGTRRDGAARTPGPGGHLR